VVDVADAAVSEERNARVIRDMYAAFTSHDPEGIRGFLAPEFEWMIVARDEVIRDAEEMVEGDREFFAKFPDVNVDIHNLIARGSFVVVEWRGCGTNTGPWDENTPATGRSFDRLGCSVAELDGNGKIIRYRDYFDRAQMLRPLGLLDLI
jgi:steroid delta-isomerase-like uncharacterized protein